MAIFPPPDASKDRSSGQECLAGSRFNYFNVFDYPADDSGGVGFTVARGVEASFPLESAGCWTFPGVVWVTGGSTWAVGVGRKVAIGVIVKVVVTNSDEGVKVMALVTR